MDSYLRRLEILFLLIYIIVILTFPLVVRQFIDIIIKNITSVIIKKPPFTKLKFIFSYFLKDFINNILLFKENLLLYNLNSA
jgi:hypothetical protein